MARRREANVFQIGEEQLVDEGMAIGGEPEPATLVMPKDSAADEHPAREPVAEIRGEEYGGDAARDENRNPGSSEHASAPSPPPRPKTSRARRSGDKSPPPKGRTSRAGARVAALAGLAVIAGALALTISSRTHSRDPASEAAPRTAVAEQPGKTDQRGDRARQEPRHRDHNDRDRSADAKNSHRGKGDGQAEPEPEPVETSPPPASAPVPEPAPAPTPTAAPAPAPAAPAPAAPAPSPPPAAAPAPSGPSPAQMEFGDP